MQRGIRPPVKSLALTAMSASTLRNEAAVHRPRRYRPTKTSSKITGRPDQDVSFRSPVGLAVVIENSCGLLRTTSIRQRWNKGSL